jgi:hypothetical protein
MSELARAMERGGASLWAWLGPMTLATALVLALALLADRLLERRVSASARVWLLGAVLLRLALPAGWATPLGLLGARPSIAVMIVDGPVNRRQGSRRGRADGAGARLLGGRPLRAGGGLAVAGADGWAPGELLAAPDAAGPAGARGCWPALAPGVEVLEHERARSGWWRACSARKSSCRQRGGGAGRGPGAPWRLVACATERAHVERRDHLAGPRRRPAACACWPGRACRCGLAARRMRRACWSLGLRPNRALGRQPTRASAGATSRCCSPLAERVSGPASRACWSR